jgi:hypothetical protein
MIGKPHAVLLALSICALPPNSGQSGIADMVCEDSARLQERLTQRTGALRQGRGLHEPGTLIEMWVTPDTGDWTLVQSYPDGISCIVAMGAYWENTQSTQDPS